MDLLLLVAQVALIVLLVVLPLFSAYDKWNEWPMRRKVIAIALALGIAVVAFGQYRRIVRLHDNDLRDAVGNVGLFEGAWFARRISFPLWEYFGTLVSGSLLLSLAVDTARRKRWKHFSGYVGAFALMVFLAILLKIRRWGGD